MSCQTSGHQHQPPLQMDLPLLFHFLIAILKPFSALLTQLVFSGCPVENITLWTSCKRGWGHRLINYLLLWACHASACLLLCFCLVSVGLSFFDSQFSPLSVYLHKELRITGHGFIHIQYSQCDEARLNNCDKQSLRQQKVNHTVNHSLLKGGCECSVL